MIKTIYEEINYKTSYIACDVFSADQTLNPLSANPTNWSNTLEQFVGNLPTNCLSVFDHFVNLALKGLKSLSYYARI